jgi:hypothetical protein
LACQSWKRKKRQADAEGRLYARQLEAMRSPDRQEKVSLKEAVRRHMKAAYLHASGNGVDPAKARQIMYSIRPDVLAETGGRCWKSDRYFTQTLLPAFVDAHPELTADWDIIYEARGKLLEPYTGHRVDLGTLQVRQYLDAWVPDLDDQPPTVTVPVLCPTCGPANRYRFALFIEKEGFEPLLDRHQIAERYGIAVFSTKGMSVLAARKLVDRLSQEGVRVGVLHDLDRSGFSIIHTLCTDSPRYRFSAKPNVIDLGLRLADLEKKKWRSLLERGAEPVEYKNVKVDPRVNLRKSGATEKECEFLVEGRNSAGRWHGRRVELNVLTSPQFVELLADKFEEHGVKKVVPVAEALEKAFRRAWKVAALQDAVNAVLAEHEGGVAPAPPPGLATKLAQAIKGTDLCWDHALMDAVRQMRAKRKK